MFLLEDTIPSFSSLVDLNNYKSKIDLSSSNRVLLPKIDENIGFIFCDVFSSFCNKFDFFESYDKKCYKELITAENFRNQAIIDIFFAPFFVDVFLSALYTAEYLKNHKYYIRIPEFIHYGKSITQSQISEICNEIYVESSISDTRPNIILKPYKSKTNDVLTNNEYTSARAVFKGKKISHCWTKLYKTSLQELNHSSLQAIPLFLNNIAMDLLSKGNLNIGIKTTNIDIYSYFKWLFVNQKTPSDIKPDDNDKHLLLQYYKLECVFRPRLVTEFIKVLTSSEDYLIDEKAIKLKDEKAIKLLIEVLNCKFISPIPIIEMMEYIPNESKQKGLPSIELQKLSSSYNMFLYGYSNDYFDFNCFPNDYIMHNFFTQLSDNITTAKKDFFSKLFNQFNSLDIISNKLFTSLIDTDYLKDFCSHYSTYFTHEDTAETKLFKRQKSIVKKSLEKYWNI